MQIETNKRLRGRNSMLLIVAIVVRSSFFSVKEKYLKFNYILECRKNKAIERTPKKVFCKFVFNKSSNI